MFSKSILYFLFCVLCAAKPTPPPGGPQDGLPWGSTTTPLPGGPQDGLPGGSQDHGQLPEHLVAPEEFQEYDIEIISGDKKGSEWLILDKEFICHRNDRSATGTYHYWECRSRRLVGCPFKMETMVDDDGKHSIMYMYDLDTHTCTQDKVDIYKQLFRNKIKHAMQTDFRAKYKNVYEDTKKDMLKEIID